MNQTVVLDTGVLGLLTHPRGSAESQQCKKWFRTLITYGTIFVLPEIVDYEVRLEVLHTGQTKCY